MAVERICRLTEENLELLKLTPDEEIACAPKPILSKDEVRKARNKRKKSKSRR